MKHFQFIRSRVPVLALIGLLSVCVGPTVAEAQQTATAARRSTLRLSLALTDKSPLPWDGRIELSQGRVVQLLFSPSQAGTVQGSSWRLKARKQGPGRPRQARAPKRKKPLVRPVLLATLDAPEMATVSVSTEQGDFSFVLGDLPLGAPRTFLGGRAHVERVPSSKRLTTSPDDDDWPAAARGADGNVWVAYMAYQNAGPLDLELIHGQRKFDSLKPKGNGDQVRLLSFDGEAWSRPENVTSGGLDVWRPAVAVDGQGTVWVLWSQNTDGNWDLHARGYDPGSGKWTKATRLTEAPGADVYAVAVTDPKSGAVYVAWQGWRDGNFDILLTSLEGGRAAAEKRLSQSPANEWSPAAAFDSNGVLHVAFDTYEKGNYDVKLISGANTAKPRTVAVAASARFEARPSLAVDKTNRVWVAYEEAGVNWGKDFGTRWGGRSGGNFYTRRTIILRCVEGGRVRQAVGEVPAAPTPQRYPAGQERRISLPRLAIDGAGRLWLLLRRHRLASGAGELWTSFVTYHTGDGWAAATRLAHSENVLDNRPAVIPLADGGLLAVHSTDGRTGGTKSAKQNDLYCTLARVDRAAKAPELVAPPQVDQRADPVHPNEPEEIRRVRRYRATIGGKTYQLLRGEFHRHTELTSHRDQDGLLEEIWRYGLDVASMDWLGDGDHDNGYGVEYLWWLVQKQTDIFHHPPTFTPMYTYERSVSYPSGHRNAMFARRGIRPLPRIPGGRDRLFGTPEEGSPDIKTFYAYLKHFDGICASHTSGTNMGTDWRDYDPEVEPVVEIYQGHRQNYEHQGAPGSAKNAQDSIGGYRPAGFVWNALKKGYRLGFEVSSDHVSTHLSYAVVFAERPSREAIHQAFKQRHCYGANDNIILDVRCGEKMMGEKFTLRGKPKLDVTVIGTKPIARLSIIRGVQRDMPRYVYDIEPNKQELKLSWTDLAPEWGRTNYYYVRIEQVRPKDGPGGLAWASPMWIDVKR